MGIIKSEIGNLYISTSLHLYTYISPHLYISTPIYLYISTPLHLYISTSLHLYISTSLHLHISTSLYPTCSLSLSFLPHTQSLHQSLVVSIAELPSVVNVPSSRNVPLPSGNWSPSWDFSQFRMSIISFTFTLTISTSPRDQTAPGVPGTYDPDIAATKAASTSRSTRVLMVA